ncbi:PAS domain S-box protein [Methylomagnum sp.]
MRIKHLLLNGYIIALLVTGITLDVLLSLQPTFEGSPPLLLFSVAVMLAAWRGGFGAGFLATVLSAVASAYFLLEPYHSVFIADPRERLRVGLLVAVGASLSLVIAVLRKAELRSWRVELEREATERRLGESEQRYRELFENSSDAIFLIDVTADGRFRFAELNPADERLMGLSSTDVAGRFIEEVVPETMLARVNANFRRCVAGGAPIAFEETLEFPPGSRHLDTTLIPVRNVASEIYRIVGIVHDITERKRIEELLRKQVALEERLAKIAANAPGVMCNFQMRPDGSTCIPYAAPGIVDLYCLDPDEMAEDASIILPLIHPDDVERVNRSIAESARTLSPWRDEYRVRHPIKGEIWIEGRSTPQADTDGGITWHGFLHDVTERKRAQEQLALVSFALNHVQEAAYLIDEQARFCYVNDGACRVLGYSRNELLPLSVPDVGSGWSMDHWTQHWRDLKAHGSLTFEADHRAKDGHIFPVEINANYFEYEGRGYNLGLARDITERKQAEKVLLHYAAIVESSDDAIIGKTADGILTSWNRGAERVFGYRSEEAIGKSITFLIPDDRVGEERMILDKITHGLSIEHYETVRRRKDGKLIDVSVTISPLRDAEGKIVGASKIARDITENKRLQAALQEHERKLEEAQRVAHVGYWDRDYHTGQVTISEESRRIFGLPPGERVFNVAEWHALWLELVHLDDRPRVSQIISNAMRGGVRYDVEYRLVQPGGEVLFVHSVGDTTRDESGRLLRLFGMIHDITERKRAEARILESEARFRQMADEAPVMIWLADESKMCSYFNRPWLEFTGRTLEQELGVGWAEGIHTEDRDRCLSTYTTAFEARQAFEMEYRLRRHDGEYRWILDRGIPRYAADAKFLGYIGSCIDINDRKHLEAALHEADQRKNEFLAMLSHELRNPLAPIRNAVYLMRKLEMPDPKLHWARDVVDRQVTHLTRLVDDLLDVSRIVQGKLTLRTAPIDIVTVIDQAIEVSRPFIEARRHTLAISMPHEPMRVEGDGVRLIQVISNLLDNAAKYTPEGGRIWLDLACRNGEAVLSIRDTGEGISSALLPYVFEVFTQGERPLDRTQGGLGLGLTIVQNIVVLHGGRIEVRSEGPGQGSEFVVRLPVLEPEPKLVQGIAGR